jgi:hypothetical protein
MAGRKTTRRDPSPAAQRWPAQTTRTHRTTTR